MTSRPLRVELTIKTDYLPNWGVWEGVRELIQNARDAEIEHESQMEVRHLNSILVVKNDGVNLPHEALLLGHTSKATRTDTIGKFGEGLKLGVLALVRAGYKVVIQTGEEIWRPTLEDSLQFAGQTVLVFTIDKRPRRTSPQVRVEVEGISLEQWEEFKKAFLFLSERKGDDSVSTDYGTLLLAPRMKGRIHVKGIYVQSKTNLSYGYDLTGDVDLDRDRRIVSSYDLEYKAAQIWRHAVLLRPDLMDPFYKLLEDAAGDVALWNYSAAIHTETSAALADKFQARFGVGALPVTTLGDSKDLEHLGRKGVVVSKPLANVLSQYLGALEDVKQSLAEEVVEKFSWGDLSDPERYNLDRAIELLDGRCSINDVDVVKFRSANLLGQYKSGRIFLSKRILTAFKDTLATLVHEVAHHNGDDGEKGHMAALEAIWSDIVVKLLEARLS